MDVIHCPSCHAVLSRESQPPFQLWHCHRCNGCAATMATLRQGIRNDFLQKVWDRTVGHARKRNRRCPGCSGLMYLVPTEGPEIDLCRNCYLIWFDAGELNEIPRRSESEVLSEQWKERLGQWRIRRERQAAERRAQARRYARMSGAGVFFVI